MRLPKKFYSLIPIIFLSVGFFLTFTFTVYANDTQINPETQPLNSTVTPLPTQNTPQNIVPIPTPNQYYQTQKALFGVDLGPVDDVAGLVGGIAKCAIPTQWGDCVKSAASAAIEGAVYLFEHSMITQIVGGAMDEILAFAETRDTARLDDYITSVANGSVPSGNLGLLGLQSVATQNFLALNLPINSGQYFESINPFPSAHASGYDDLNSGVVLSIWTGFRNAALALSVVALVIIGFMIMIRFPLGPRNAVNLQNSLPRIIIALILITFSFAIAGLMIDLTRILAGFLNNLVPLTLEAQRGVQAIFIWVGIMAVATLTTGGTAGVFFLVLLLLGLILALILLVVFFVILFKLLTRYVTFLILVMFAPFFFLFGALPGGSGIIGSWFKRTSAALLAIPLTGLVLNLAFAIGFSGVGGIGGLSNGASNAVPPIYGLIGGPLTTAFSWLFLAPLVGLGLLFFATKVPDIVDEVLGAKQLGARAGIGFMQASGLSAVGAGIGMASTLNRAGPGINAFLNTVPGIKGNRITTKLTGLLNRFQQPGAPTKKDTEADKTSDTKADTTSGLKPPGTT